MFRAFHKDFGMGGTGLNGGLPLDGGGSPPSPPIVECPAMFVHIVLAKNVMCDHLSFYEFIFKI